MDIIKIIKAITVTTSKKKNTVQVIGDLKLMQLETFRFHSLVFHFFHLQTVF